MATAAIDIAVATNSAAQVITNAAQTVALDTSTYNDAAKFTHDATNYTLESDGALSWIEAQGEVAWQANTLSGAWHHVVKAWIETSDDDGTTWTVVAGFEGAAAGTRASDSRTEELGQITFTPALLVAGAGDLYRMRIQQIKGTTDIKIAISQARLSIKDVVAEHFPPG